MAACYVTLSAKDLVVQRVDNRHYPLDKLLRYSLDSDLSSVVNAWFSQVQE